MKQHDNINLKDEALKEFIEASAGRTNPNPVFQSELEKRLIDAHKPKTGFRLPSLKQFGPMLGWAVVIVLLVLGFNWMLRALNPVQMPASNNRSCAVTQPNGSMPPGENIDATNILGNDQLWTGLWPDGKVNMSPENQEADGSFSVKWFWWRGVTGPLTIEGHRLDAEAEPLRADIPDGYGDTGYQVSALIFPSTGCWEVTGRVGDASLTFVTEVVFRDAIPTPVAITVPTSAPEGEAYDWNGTKLYLNAPLPDSPTEANILLPQPEHMQGTIEDAQKLAKQFGLQGKIYNAPGELPATATLLVVDGKQRLNVRSDQYFTYYPDYAVSYLGNTTMDNPNSQTLIDEFMKSHGFDFAYRIEPSEFYGGYYAQPLTSDGFALHHENFKANGLLFKFNDAGIVSVEASLLKYSNVFHPYVIRSAKEAFQKLLDPNTTAGSLMGMHSSPKSPQTWVRVRPKDQTITIYGFLGVSSSFDGGAPLVTFDGYTVTGSLPDINNFLGTNSLAYSFVEATGQFHTQNDMDVFEIESWKPYNGQEEGYQGTIQREGGQVVINTIEGRKLILPDIPSDVPLPLENAYIMGITRGDTFEWKSFDTRLAQGGGGGGGGGSGFYKLNLTGTPVPLPTPEPVTLPQVGGQYIVKQGDTLSAIAQASGVSLDSLMQANGLTDPGMLFVGQVLIIPSQSNQKIENLRGILTITIYNQVDGSRRVEYGFVSSYPAYHYMLLEGKDLQSLQNFHNRPVNIWGTIDHFNQAGIPIIKVEKFEIPFPDLKFQVLKGTEKTINIQDQTALLFTSEDGKSYVQLAPNCYDVIGPDSVVGTGKVGELLLLEALIVPDLTFGGYPAICVFSTSMAVNPKNGQPAELTITANQPYITNEPASQETYTPPTANIEKVELVYYVPDPRYLPPDPNSDQAYFHPAYIEPAWRFYGHYSNGDEFEILIQALKDEFLLPELAPFTAPG